MMRDAQQRSVAAMLALVCLVGGVLAWKWHRTVKHATAVKAAREWDSVLSKLEAFGGGAPATNALFLAKHELEVLWRGLEGEHARGLQEGERWDQFWRLRNAMKAVGTNGTGLLPLLSEAYLSETNIAEAEWGLECLGDSGWRVVVQGLTSHVADVRISSANTMWNAPPSVQSLACPILLKNLHDTSVYLRARSAGSLGGMPHEADRAGGALLEALRNDPHHVVRFNAARALGGLGLRTERVRAALKEASRGDPSPVVRTEAARSLRRWDE